MRHSDLSFLFAMFTAAGCVGLDEPDLELDSVEESIGNGSSQLATSFGVALVSSACSATMISNEIALTTEGCGVTGRTAVIAGTSSKVRNVRVPRRSTGNDAKIVAIQLQKPLGLASANGITTTGFSKPIDSRVLVQGDKVTCFGYSNNTLKSGQFDVIDGSTDKLYKLRGRIDQPTGNLWKITAQDLGGYCERDGGGIAAILTVETGLGDIARAIPVHDLGAGLGDVVYAKDASLVGVAVRLRDDAGQRFLTAIPNTDRVLAGSTSTDLDQRDQAFYLDKVSNPPASGVWNRLVDARSGRCLTVVGAALTQRSCVTANRDQMFVVQYKEVNGNGRYLVIGQGGLADADGTPSVTMHADDADGSQRFEMWLTQL